MICPAKTCKIEIDDNSKFCDQCGSEIMICSKCQLPGTGKFCAKDGTRLESQKKNTPSLAAVQTTSQPQNTAQPSQHQASVQQPLAQNQGVQPKIQGGSQGMVQQSPSQNQAASIAQAQVQHVLNNLYDGKTGDVNFEGNKSIDELVIVHSGGLELKIKSNDLLGRGEGPHAAQLGSFKFLSRKHALIFNDSGNWLIKDLGSTNKTRLNGIILEPDKGYPVKKDDRIFFADQEFTVK